MLDAFGQEINVGDVVAINRYKDTGFEYGKVTKLTPKRVRVQVKTNEWLRSFYLTRWPGMKYAQYWHWSICQPKQLIVLDDALVTKMMLEGKFDNYHE